MDEEDDLQNTYWKQNLYLLQERAPKPKIVECIRRIVNRPPQYGAEFHGLIERAETDKMLRDTGDGAYLIRASRRAADAYTLCLLFDGNVMNYKLFFDGQHYVAEKRFETLELLVADGLIAMFIDKYVNQTLVNTYYEKRLEKGFKHPIYG